VRHRPWAMFTKEQVVEATKGSFGIVSKIAKNLGGCSWQTARSYIDHWEDTRAAYADENERSLDLSESKMLEQIGDGDGPMIRFHLATKGKARGYTERHDIGGHLLNVDVSKLTEEQLERIAGGEDIAAVLAAARSG